ncbi:MAG TPA: adenylate/guanylate cyclase domain-containing protein [Acidimicrobiales bacterium]|nr:adenylate/guanylate cyclase domain-containing protein [Acidimicrobiales bacterium]
MVGGQQTRYVPVGDSDVAYQVVGDGPVDLLWAYNLGTQVDLVWDVPFLAKSLHQFSAATRFILLDRRGSGASGRLPVNGIPTWEALTEDITAVLDAAGSRRTAILAMLETGPIAILFAAMHPERVSSLILLTTTARYSSAPDYPIGVSPNAIEDLMELLIQTWGTEDLTQLAIPSRPEAHKQMAMVQRASATPREAVSQFRYFTSMVDVRNVLPLISVPTLVIHAKDNPFMPMSHGRYLAEHIAGATFQEAETPDLAVYEDVVAEVLEFVTGQRPASDTDRILTTVLFSDIVGSTERAAELGDRAWRALLDAHDQAVRIQLGRFRGREIKTTGDGFVVSFDGPARAVRCATALVESTRSLGIDIRTGIHTGECEVRGDDLGGLAVHIAARVGSLAAPGQVMVSSTVKDLVVGSGIGFNDRGEHVLKGVPGTWRLFTVVG